MVRIEQIVYIKIESRREETTQEIVKYLQEVILDEVLGYSIITR